MMHIPANKMIARTYNQSHMARLAEALLLLPLLLLVVSQATFSC